MSLLVQAASYLGNYALSSIVYFKFSVTDATGVLTTLGGTPVVKVYKDGGTTESTAGVTLTVDFDARTGLCQVAIDTSSDGTFYSAGSEFEAVITTGTVGVVSVAGTPVGHFSLLNRVDTLANGVTHGGTTALLRLGSNTSTPALYVTSSGGSAAHFDCTSTSTFDCGLKLTTTGGVGFYAKSTKSSGTGMALDGHYGLYLGYATNVNEGIVVKADGSCIDAQTSTNSQPVFSLQQVSGLDANCIELAASGIGHDLALIGSGDILGKLAANALDNVLVDGKTLPASLQIIAALTAGKASGAGTSTEVFKGLDGSTTRASMTVDASGNRTGASYS